MKNKEQEIKDIEERMRLLADRVAKLKEPEQREPEAGDVWEYTSGEKILVTDGSSSCRGRYVYLNDCAELWGASDSIGAFNSHRDRWTYLGKFEDLYTFNGD